MKDLFSALGDPTRRQMLHMLKDGRPVRGRRLGVTEQRWPGVACSQPVRCHAEVYLPEA